ncbi:SNARE domain protein [Microthyrium microscopicum]|uniref:SNARE domain protein n=1 Tax=Microthyrium microscopicum TaxID=703497 RepID=A0A6A6TZ48_9PEZI|nr:SNARE domain protein [Microthyrium microscopicum]
MSYERGSALESQPTTQRREDDPQFQDDPEFVSFSSELSDKLFSLTSTVSRLSNEVALLGTRRESERVRERARELIDQGSKEFKSVGEGLKKVLTWPDVGPSQRFTQGKLNREFQASLKEFQELQRTALEKERNAAAASRAALDDQATSPSGSSPLGQRQLQEQEQLRLASQDEVDFQESLIIERESEIRNIEQSVGELNELFRDVAHMIHEQGEQLDIIQEHAYDTREDTRAAHVELNQAYRYQKNARNRMCCLLLVLLVVLTIIILAVALA